MGVLTVPAQQNSSRSDTSLLGHFDDRCCCEERATCAAQRTVRSDNNTLLLAEVDDLLLWEGGVVLDLVDGRNNGSLGQKLLEVLHTVVGDTDGLDLAGGQELLHALPGGDVGVRVNDIAGTVFVLGEEGVVACHRHLLELRRYRRQTHH